MFMKKIIFHIDVNNAFLSWTAVDLLNHGSKYDIRNSYAVIGGDESERRGIVLAKSNPCKKLGIKTADTLYSARRRCPALRVYKGDYKLFKKMSKSMFDLIRTYTPDIEILSIDECFLDYTSIQKIHGDPIKFAYKLKDEIYEKLGFTVNIGIGENKLTAKMASDFEKPNKVHTLFKEEIKSKMYPLPVGDLFGIGKKTAEKLNKINIMTISDLANQTPEKLYPYFKNMSIKMIESANGLGSTEIITGREIKGISNSTTLPYDVKNINEIKETLFSLCENVTLELQKQRKYAYVVCVSLKDSNFKMVSHQKKLTNATDVVSEIYKVALSLLLELWKNESIRLIGVRLDKLTEHPIYQPSLFEKQEIRKENKQLNETILKLKDKYGRKVITSANKKQVGYKKRDN